MRTFSRVHSKNNQEFKTMKVLLSIAVGLIVIVIGNTVIVAQGDMKPAAMKPPVANKVPKVLKIHGYEIVDNYAWLRDRGDKKDPAILDYLNAENTYTESFVGRHKPLMDKLYQEMLGRIKQTDLSVPYKYGDY